MLSFTFTVIGAVVRGSLTFEHNRGRQRTHEKIRGRARVRHGS
ncbi:hypothetical protein AKJ09_00374 [Labilithrix luteola]|uniref:Uncharacterized protein n=1 Tax=Labilithrix luteola TaxID=1391654 RepID=A0A0K1PJM0_9BACT|nr:hypothetical protein AKJ09_00374 [Labilithrix luteola]